MAYEKNEIFERLVQEGKMKSLMMGFTPPEEGGSERHIYEISSRMPESTVFTQRGSLCKNKIEAPLIEKPLFLRNILFAFLSFFYAIKLMAWKKYNVIHIHENVLYFLVPLLRIRYKVIVTVHGIKGFKFYDNRFLWFFFRIPLKFANGVVSVSLEDKKLLDKEFNNVSYIPNGVDLSVYKNIKINPEKKITFVGRIHKQKGVEYLMEAFTKFSKKYPDYRLELIGKKEGDLYNKLSKKYSNKKIIWRGFILDRKKLFSEIASSKMLVYPSLWEALPWPALLEALASGRPVIASGLNGMRKIFHDSEDIMLVGPKDSRAIYAAMTKLAEYKLYGDKLGKNGKITAEKYSWDSISETLNKVYNTL